MTSCIIGANIACHPVTQAHTCLPPDPSYLLRQFWFLMRLISGYRKPESYFMATQITCSIKSDRLRWQHTITSNREKTFSLMSWGCWNSIKEKICLQCLLVLCTDISVLLLINALICIHILISRVNTYNPLIIF